MQDPRPADRDESEFCKIIWELSFSKLSSAASKLGRFDTLGCSFSQPVCTVFLSKKHYRKSKTENERKRWSWPTKFGWGFLNSSSEVKRTRLPQLILLPSTLHSFHRHSRITLWPYIGLYAKHHDPIIFYDQNFLKRTDWIHVLLLIYGKLYWAMPWNWAARSTAIVSFSEVAFVSSSV